MDDAHRFLMEYARRFNEGNATGDLSGAAGMRTEDARLLWRAPDMDPIEGRIASAGEAIPIGATIEFSDVEQDGDGIRAHITGRGFPAGEVAGIARFTLQGDKIARLEVDLDTPLRRT